MAAQFESFVKLAGRPRERLRTFALGRGTEESCWAQITMSPVRAERGRAWSRPLSVRLPYHAARSLSLLEGGLRLWAGALQAGCQWPVDQADLEPEPLFAEAARKGAFPPSVRGELQ